MPMLREMPLLNGFNWGDHRAAVTVICPMTAFAPAHAWATSWLLRGNGRCPVVRADHRAPVSYVVTSGELPHRNWNGTFSASPPKAERTVMVPSEVGRSAVATPLTRSSQVQTPRVSVGEAVPTRVGVV